MHKVRLKFWDDDATDDWGLSPINSINVENPFNAAFTPTMIFHDSFEHWFEDKHKYFLGKNAFNVGGEVAAMGAMWCYYEEYYERLNNSYHSPQDNCIATTLYMMQEGVEDGFFSYGERLECGVPYQPPVECGDLEYIIDEHWQRVKGFKVSEEGQEYFNSITRAKLANLYRWGYRMAQRMKLDWDAIHDFMDFFEGFCAKNSAEELAYYFKGLTIRWDSRKRKWSATLVADPYGEVKNVRLKDYHRNFPVELW